MKTLTPQQFVNLLERAVVRAPIVAAVALTETMEAVAVEAKSYIGHEMPGWAPLAESTVAEKQRLGYTGHLSPTDPLLRTGEMRESIGSSVDAATLTGVVGSTDKLAAFQELGTAHIPPRPFLSTSMFRAQPAAELFFGRAAVALLTPK
jgi:phage gpG-like protein